VKGPRTRDPPARHHGPPRRAARPRRCRARACRGAGTGGVLRRARRTVRRLRRRHRPIYRPWLTAAVPDLSTQPGSRAVDLGCGTGRFTALLADRHTDVLAVDIAARTLAIARATDPQPHVRFEHRSLLEVTPDLDGRFDTVLTVNTIHHLRAHHTVLPHLRSLLAPGGHLLAVDITDPVRGWCTDSAPPDEPAALPAPNVSAWQRLHPPRDLR